MTKYDYLRDDDIPRAVREAVKYIGVREFVGEDHNPIIIDWGKEILPYLGIAYNSDETPWCGLFVGMCVNRAGFKPIHLCLRAKEWLKFGWARETPEIGNILVFNRARGGHVGFYVGEDKYYYHVLGGNQGDAVKVARIEKKRLCENGIREIPWKVAKPKGAVRKFLTPDGEVTHDEA